jgi:hypothetical protein
MSDLPESTANWMVLPGGTSQEDLLKSFAAAAEGKVKQEPSCTNNENTKTESELKTEVAETKSAPRALRDSNKRKAVKLNASEIVDLDLWNRMRVAYEEHATMTHVIETCGTPALLTKKAILTGFPEQCLPPLCNKPAPIKSPRQHLAELDTESETGIRPSGLDEAAKQKAHETLAARVTMKSAMQAAKLSQKYAAKMLELIDSGKAEFPEELTPKVLYQVVKSLEASSAVMERAMKIELLKNGPAEDVLGAEIGSLLGRMTEAEVYIVARTGQIPTRVLAQRIAIAGKIAQDKLAPKVQAIVEAHGVKVPTVPADAAEDDECTFDVSAIEADPLITPLPEEVQQAQFSRGSVAPKSATKLDGLFPEQDAYQAELDAIQRDMDSVDE